MVLSGHADRRPALVRLFSTILRREGEDYFLVTPVEKVGITVDDAPFVAVDFERTGTGVARCWFRHQCGRQGPCRAGAPDPGERDPDTGEPSPYVLVRADL